MSAQVEDYTDSLDRLLEILRGQIALARAISIGKVVVRVDDLERLLNILQGDKESELNPSCSKT